MDFEVKMKEEESVGGDEGEVANAVIAVPKAGEPQINVAK